MKRFSVAIFISLAFLLTSCAKKKVPYYLFHIGRDVIVTDSAGRVIKDTFYTRINLGYSYENIKDIDTVLIPRYVVTVDPARHIRVSMFNGITGIRPKDLSIIFSFTPQKMTYVKGIFGLHAERLVKVVDIDTGYLILTSMDIYRIDKQGHLKASLNLFTSKDYYGFLIVDAYRINQHNFLIIGDQDFGIYNFNTNAFTLVGHKRPSTRAFFLNGTIMRIEALKRTPYEAMYALVRYSLNGKEKGMVKMPMLKNQYHVFPFVRNNILYVLTERKLYKLNPQNFSVVSSVNVDARYDSIWDVGEKFILYSPKEKKIAEIPYDFSSFNVLAENTECSHIYVSRWLISCEKNDTTYIYTPRYKPLISLTKVLFVKDMFVGTRNKDTLTVYRVKDTFLSIPSPYYTYQRSLIKDTNHTK